MQLKQYTVQLPMSIYFITKKNQLPKTPEKFCNAATKLKTEALVYSVQFLHL